MTDPFHNDWQAVCDTPASRFRTAPAPELLARASAWHLPDPAMAIVRIQDKDTGLITEKVYKRLSRAQSVVQKNEEAGHYVTAYTEESMYCSNGFIEDDDDAYDDDEDE
jgi:hypothetical protein